MLSDLPGASPSPVPGPGQAPQNESLARLRRALAQDAPSPLQRELVARRLLLTTPAPPLR